MAILRILLFALVLLAPAGLAAVPTAAPAVASSPALGDCADCGKRIFFGERCLTCIVAEKRRAKEHPCVDCEETILFGERCAGCSLVRGRARLAEALAHPCADCETEIHLGLRCRPCAGANLDRRLSGLLELAERGTAGAKALAPAARERLESVPPASAPPRPTTAPALPLARPQDPQSSPAEGALRLAMSTLG